VIMKSISAFNNAEGGTLIIGVNDEGEVLGLDKDYAHLKGGRDEFELHLRNYVNKSFGKVFASTGIAVQFHELHNMDICQITIKKGGSPLYLEVQDKNGQKQEKFYLRSGNSSQELSPSEIGEYVKRRFR